MAPRWRATEATAVEPMMALGVFAQLAPIGQHLAKRHMFFDISKPQYVFRSKERPLFQPSFGIHRKTQSSLTSQAPLYQEA
jgi:hypothetical protein